MGEGVKHYLSFETPQMLETFVTTYHKSVYATVIAMQVCKLTIVFLIRHVLRNMKLNTFIGKLEAFDIELNIFEIKMSFSQIKLEAIRKC